VATDGEMGGRDATTGAECCDLHGDVVMVQIGRFRFCSGCNAMRKPAPPRDAERPRVLSSGVVVWVRIAA